MQGALGNVVHGVGPGSTAEQESGRGEGVDPMAVADAQLYRGAEKGCLLEATGLLC